MKSMRSSNRVVSNGLTLVLVAMLVTGVAGAGNVDWNNAAPGDNYWNTPANWAGGNLPQSGDNPRFFGGPKGAAITAAYTADLNGATVNVGTGTVGFYKGSEGGFALVDLAGGGSVTCGVLHVQQGGRPAYEIRVPVTATTEIRTRYRLGGVKFYEELTTPEMDLGRGDVYLYGDVNATTEFKVVRDDNTTNAYLMPNPEVGGSPVPTLTTPLVHVEDSSSKFEASGIVDADTIEITNGGRYFAKHAQALGDASTTVTVNNGGYLQIDQPQANLASVAIGPFSVLAGNLNGATFGAGGRVALVENAVLAPAPGSPVPTRADLGGDAILYQGLTTSNKTITVGDNETDAIYKGGAVGAFYGTGTMSGVSVTATPGSGDLQVVYAGAGCPTTGNNNKFYGDGTSTTADISVLNGALLRLTGSLNSDYNYAGGSEPTRIDTFNISGEVGKEAATILDHYRTNGTHLKEGQTWNISHGKWNPGTYFAGRGQHGQLTLTDGIMQQAGTAYSASADTGFALALAGRTVVETHNAANHGFLEQLGANFSYSGMPVCTFTNNQNYAIDYSPAGANPILADLLIHSDLSSATYQQVKFSTDLQIGHEKYLYNTLYRADDDDGVGTDTGAKIIPAGNQPAGEKAILGFAAMGGRQNPIDMAVDAPGGIVRVGTTDPNRIMVANSGGFVTSIPDAAVYFRRSVTADELQVRSGTARLGQDLAIATLDIAAGSTLRLDGGTTATVTEMLRGGGTWTGGNGVVLAPGATLAPGDSVGTLAGNAHLVIGSAAKYEWELADPDAAPGTGWDLFEYANNGPLVLPDALTFLLADAGLTRDVAPTEEFLVAASADGWDIPSFFDITFDAGTTGWDISRAALIPRQGELWVTGIDARLETQGEIPEPATIALLSLAACGLGGYVRRRRKA